jgi:AraC-like DNA-binding protein
VATVQRIQRTTSVDCRRGGQNTLERADSDALANLCVSDFVLMQRLTRAHRMLGDPAFAERSIGAIAYEVGFGDLSYFNRAFRRRFGATPSDVREAARRGRDA